MTPAWHDQLPQRPPTRRGRRPRLQLPFPLAPFLSSSLPAVCLLVCLPCLAPAFVSNRRSRQRLRQSSPPGLRALSFRADLIFRPRYPWRPCRSRVRKAVLLHSRTRQTSCATPRPLHSSPTLQPMGLLLQ